MADQAQIWWLAVGIGGGGAILGCLGGLLGCYFSIRNTKGPCERAFMVRMSVLCFLGVALFLATLGATPRDFRPLVWLPYPFALIWAIRTMNRRQSELRQQEAEQRI